MESPDVDSYISIRTQMLMAVFNRKHSDELVDVFKETLRAYPMDALKSAFKKAETELERFPTPKLMREICNGCMPSNAWKYRPIPSTAKDPETGEIVPCNIDPETGKKVFLPQHCPEGREFLAKMREIRNQK